MLNFIEQLAGRLPADDNAWLDESEVCQYLKVSAKTLQRLRNSGDLKYSTVAKNHFYKAGDIKVLMERKAVENSKWQMEKLRSSYKKHLFRKNKRKDTVIQITYKDLCQVYIYLFVFDDFMPILCRRIKHYE